MIRLPITCGRFAVARSALIAAGLLAIWPTPASAEPALDWAAPDGADCPDRSEVIGGIERALGAPLASYPDAAARISVESAGPSGGWRVQVRVRVDQAGREGRRELTAATCREAGEAAALVLAIAIDPDAVARTAANVAEPPGATSIATPAAAEHATADAAAGTTDGSAPAGGAVDDEPIPAAGAIRGGSASALATGPNKSGPPLTWIARSSVTSELGALPGRVPGVALAFGVERGAWRGELGASYWFARDKRLSDTDGGGELSLAAAGLRGCRQTGLLGGWLCVGGEFGAMRGRGFGADQTFDRSAAWLAASAALTRTWKVSKFLGIYLEAEALVPLRRPRFTLDDQALHQANAVSGRLAVGAALELP